MLKPPVVVVLLLCLPSVQTAGADERDLALEIRHEVLDQLGSEHIPHAIHHQRAGGVMIVASEAEIANARLGVFQRADNDPTRPWNCHVIDRGLYCRHSLVVTDLLSDPSLARLALPATVDS